jgi:hypothetical protein
MRAKTLALLITLTASAIAGAACAQQFAVTYTPPSSPEFNGGPGSVVQNIQGDIGHPAPAPRPVYAVISHHLVSGTLRPGSKLLDLVDESQSPFACHVFHRQSKIALACTDGSLAQVSMTALGCGHSRGGEPASLCIGVPAKVAADRLTGSPGETVSVEDGRLTLKPAA